MFKESERFWIGVDNILGDGWRNVDDRSNIIFDNWAQNEPSNDSNACVSVDKEGMWYNDNCSNDYPYICGASDDEHTTTSPTLSNTAPVAAASYYGYYGAYFDVQFNVSDMATLVEDLSQDFSSYSDLDIGIWSLTDTGLFDYKDGISVNSVVFAGNTSDPRYALELQSGIDFLTTNGSTITIVFVNQDLDLTAVQNLTNVNIVQWSDNPTELLTNIQKNMKCLGGKLAYRPCKRWFSLVPDYSTTLSETDHHTQIVFIQNEVGRMNRPDMIQFIGDHDDHYWVDWNNAGTIEEIRFYIDITMRNGNFSLNTTLQALSIAYYSKDRTRYEPPYVALVFIPSTDSYENYGGAEEVAQNLTDAGFQLTFFLM
ncbi:hypothetical protein FO519_009761, partial [Halicephalobus sp. NKZ332]